MSKIVDISSRSKDETERGLSNFAHRLFIFDDVQCLSIEGFLQSLKFQDRSTQRIIAAKWGYEAFRWGQTGNDWKNDQTLYWLGDPYCRHSLEYFELLTRAFDTQFDQNPDFRALLKSTTGSILRHSMGKSDPCDTVLTEAEYIRILERLRWRALEER